jgi:hypothetical protein
LVLATEIVVRLLLTTGLEAAPVAAPGAVLGAGLDAVYPVPHAAAAKAKAVDALR